MVDPVREARAGPELPGGFFMTPSLIEPAGRSGPATPPGRYRETPRVKGSAAGPGRRGAGGHLAGGAESSRADATVSQSPAKVNRAVSR
jgi:hypothetical protein